jgi:enoyl-CoA hydratase/carnithine racemase
VLRSGCALAHALGPRLRARLHGACVGAGIEIPAAAARVTATPDAVFRLPEVSMGLIPGAGGTASIPRRIGRHRAAYMAISGADIDAGTALAWGLVDQVGP